MWFFSSCFSKTEGHCNFSSLNEMCCLQMATVIFRKAVMFYKVKTFQHEKSIIIILFPNRKRNILAFQSYLFLFCFSLVGNDWPNSAGELVNSQSQLKAQFILQINFIKLKQKEKLQVLMLLSKKSGWCCHIWDILKKSIHPSANICIAFKTTGSIWSYLIMRGQVASMGDMMFDRAVYGPWQRFICTVAQL